MELFLLHQTTPLNASPFPTGKASTAQEQGKAMISPTGNIYCDFCGRERAECGPVTANNGMGGRCHICADCALRSIASRLGKTEEPKPMRHGIVYECKGPFICELRNCGACDFATRKDQTGAEPAYMETLATLRISEVGIFPEGLVLFLPEDREDFWLYLGGIIGWGYFVNSFRLRGENPEWREGPIGFILTELRPASAEHPAPQFVSRFLIARPRAFFEAPIVVRSFDLEKLRHPSSPKRQAETGSPDEVLR